MHAILNLSGKPKADYHATRMKFNSPSYVDDRLKRAEEVADGWRVFTAAQPARTLSSVRGFLDAPERDEQKAA